MRSVLLGLFLLFGPIGFLEAQQAITGSIITSGGKPLAGATVSVPPAAATTASDSMGRFRLTVPEGGEVLQVRLRGYVSRKITLDSSETYTVELAVREDASSPVVTALDYTRSERSLTYPVGQVYGQDITKTNENNLFSSLSGRVAGAQVNSNNSGPGGSAHLLLRGNTSLVGNHQPLLVVDGVPVANDHNNSVDAVVAARGRDFGTTLLDINPADIATVSVLRGGPAAALYGSRASNGVILVTTKKGTARQGLGVSLTSGVAFSNVSVLPEYQNQYGGGTSQTFPTFAFDAAYHPADWERFDGQPIAEYAIDQSWGPELDGRPVRHWDSWYPGAEFGQLRPWSPQPDNVKSFYGTGVSLDNTLAISGGSDRRTYRVSATNSTNSGVYPNFRLNGNTVHANLSQQIGKRLTASLRGSVVSTKGSGRPAIGMGGFGDPVNVQTSFNQWFQRQLDINRLRDYEQEDGSFRTWNIYGPDYLYPTYWESPYWSVDNNQSTDTRTRGYGGLDLTYRVLPKLSITAYARADAYTFAIEDRITAFSAAHIPYIGTTQVERHDRNLGGSATYRTTLGADIGLTAHVGGNFRKDRYHALRRKSSEDLELPGSDTLNLWFIDSTRSTLTRDRDVHSAFGQLSVDWRKLVYVDVSARQDWTSALENGYNASLSPSVSLGFVFSELLDVPWLTYGKLRGGMATVANDPLPYRTRQTYLGADPYGELPATTVPDLQANPGLVAERVATTELGADLRFFGSRLGLDINYYQSTTSNLLLTQQVNGASGFTDIRTNGGLMTNTGVELSLYGSPVATANVQWDARLQFGTNSNEVTELAAQQRTIVLDDYTTQFVAQVGQPFGTLVGTGYVRDEAGQPVVDEAGLPVMEDGVSLGSVFPDLTGGFANEWRVGSFRFGALVDFRRGGVVYSASNRWGSYSGQLANTVGTNANGVDVRRPVEEGGGILVEGVTTDGRENTTYVDAQTYFGHLLNLDEAHVYDASFVKLRELSIGYSFPDAWFGNGPIEGAGITFFARNVAILYKNTPNIDPETAVTNAGIQGFENGQSPTVRTIGLKAHVAF